MLSHILLWVDDKNACCDHIVSTNIPKTRRLWRLTDCRHEREHSRSNPDAPEADQVGMFQRPDASANNLRCYAGNVSKSCLVVSCKSTDECLQVSRGEAQR